MSLASYGREAGVGEGAGDVDRRVSLVAFAFLAEQTKLHGDVLPCAILAIGLTFDGTCAERSQHTGGV